MTKPTRPADSLVDPSPWDAVLLTGMTEVRDPVREDRLPTATGGTYL